MADKRTCSGCGAELPSNAIEGRCVSCLLAASPPDGKTVKESGPGTTIALDLPLTEKPGEKIGHYKLLQQIGEGGCGVVYMAEQQEPVKRRVAFKVIKLGMDTKEVVARFEAERQALALMDHANIAKVLDAGATENGRPYFVMELVKGIPITRYCDDNKLNTHERLKLFIQVCQAIQHAHQKGIIHRDIKPSNILVADHDGVGVPKIIDFGIAKATAGQTLTDKTVFTAFEQFIGTPAYMSPEQARMSGLDIDTRSDIYSLGVLLYELLTGRTPFDAKRLVEAGFDEIRRIIREEDPPRPSTKLSTLDAAEQTVIATRRHSEPPRLIHLVRGDLDWIVMKTLEKDRNRRYETANGLVADIQRFLDFEPIVARPPSNLYRLQKLVHRNKLAFGVASMVTASLVLGVGLLSRAYQRVVLAEREQKRLWQDAERQKVKETELRQQAEAAEALAQSEAKRAKKAAIDAKLALAVADFSQATRLIGEDHDNDALAYLVRSLSRNPADNAALTRLATLLAYRSWLLPIATLQLSNVVSSAEFSPDGLQIAGALLDAPAAQVWESQTGRACTAPLRHRGKVRVAHFSPDGRRIVTCSEDGSTRVWDAQTGGLVTEFLRHTGRVRNARFSPDSSQIVTVSDDRKAWVWDAQTGNPTTGPLQHDDIVESTQFSRDGKRLVTGSWDQTARVWDIPAGKLLARTAKQGGKLLSVQFSPDGERIVTLAEDKCVRVWSAHTCLPVSGAVEIAYGPILAQFSPDGRRVLLAAGDGRTRVVDAETGRDVGKPLGPVSPGLTEFSSDGKRLVMVAWDTADILDPQDGKRFAEPLKHPAKVTSAKFSPDSRWLLTICEDHAVRVWSVQGSRALTEPLGHGVRVSGFSPDGKRIAMGCDDKFARILDAQTGRLLGGELNHDAPVSSIDFSHDGKLLATASEDKTARLWDVQTGAPVTESLRHDAKVLSVRFSPDGKRVVTASDDKTAKVWDAQTGQPVVGPLKHSEAVLAAEFSPDGKRILTASADGTARIWDTSSGLLSTQPMKHGWWVVSAHFSADGKRIVTASWDWTIRVWDAQTGRPLTDPIQHHAWLATAQFSPDGLRILSASPQDAAAHVWDSRTGFPLTEPLRHQARVWDAQFSPDGQRIVTSSEDNTARVWDTTTGLPLMEGLIGVGSPRFSPDSKRFVVAANEARIWDVAPSQERWPSWLVELAEAISGLTLNERGVLEPTKLNRAEIINQIKQKLDPAVDDDDWVVWGRWFLGDRSTRTISPFSKVTVPEYIENRIRENTSDSLAEAERLALGNAQVLDRISKARTLQPEVRPIRTGPR